MDTSTSLYQLISQIAQIDQKQIDSNTHLINDLGFDSINMITLIVQIEEKFNILLNDEDLDLELLSKVKNLEGIVNDKTRG